METLAKLRMAARQWQTAFWSLCQQVYRSVLFWPPCTGWHLRSSLRIVYLKTLTSMDPFANSHSDCDALPVAAMYSTRAKGTCEKAFPQQHNKLFTFDHKCSVILKTPPNIKAYPFHCSVLCGTRTRRLSAIAWQPFSTWLMTPTKTRPHKPLLAVWTGDFPLSTLGLGLQVLEIWMNLVSLYRLGAPDSPTLEKAIV